MGNERGNVLITGATGGIGRETARQVAARGHRVTIVGRDASKGHESAAASETRARTRTSPSRQPTCPRRNGSATWRGVSVDLTTGWTCW
jgi:NAD(P)-dependent dehydrogenase (short-subunit alcohol dehydrogenase family)